MIGQIGTIYIIKSLDKGEYLTGSELHNDIIEKHYKYFPDEKEKLIYNLFTPANRKEFFEALEFIRYNCEYAKLGILLHLEMHGSNGGGLHLSSNEVVKWNELTEILTDINLKTCNKLYLCMATCFGRSLYNSVDIRKTSPYCGYISASKEINVAEILSDYTIIYENLLNSKNIIMAYEELENKNKNSNFYYKDTDAVFQDVMDYTFNKIQNDETVRNELIEKIKNDMKVQNVDISEFEIPEILELVQKDYREKHYPKFVLKNCH